MFTRILEALVISTHMDDRGYPVSTVVDGTGAELRNVEYLYRGGAPKNIQYCPSRAGDNAEAEVDPRTREGARVLVVLPADGAGQPAILGGLDGPLVRDTHFAEGTSKESPFHDVSKTDNYPLRVSYDDQLMNQGGAQIVLGEIAGVTLDTTDAGEAPVRVQVGADSFLRISQDGSDPVDHVMLASVLFAKLTELQATVAALQAQVTANTGSLGGMAAGAGIPHTHQYVVEGVAAPTGDAVVAAADAFVPPAITPIPAWVTGPAETLQASAVRISEKPVGDG